MGQGWRQEKALDDLEGAPRYGGDDAVDVHFADAVVAFVSEVKVAIRVEADIGGIKQLSLGGRAAIAREAMIVGASDCCDEAGLVNLADVVAAKRQAGAIGDIQVA